MGCIPRATDCLTVGFCTTVQRETQFERFHDEVDALFVAGTPSDEASNTYNSSIGINGMSGRS